MSTSERTGNDVVVAGGRATPRSEPGPGAAAGGPTRSSAPAAATSQAIPLTGLALGIDVGGTGVKAAIVDLATAELVTSRVREKTPQPSEPAAVLETVAKVVEQVIAEHGGSADIVVGCGLPGVIKRGEMKTAANLDKGWVDYDATTHISSRLGRPVHIINDADAAGMAELAYGEAAGQPGTVILLTIGTGIGSALISDGRLVPNTEFGHLLMRNKAAETQVGGAARVRRGLGWKGWARQFNQYLDMLEFFLWPDRIILGGGVSKESDKYWKYLVTKAELVKARYLNTSGIIGAAYAAGLAAHEVTARAASESESTAGPETAPGTAATKSRPGSSRRSKGAASGTTGSGSARRAPGSGG